MARDSDPDPLDALDFAMGVLVEHPDPRARQVAAAIGAYLAGEADDLFGYISDRDNLPGHSGKLEAVVSRRNELIRELGQDVTARELAAELRRYAGSNWTRRDSVLAICPYPANDRRSRLFAILKLRDFAIGEHQIRRVLQRT